jgi:hypothetical protein
VSQKTTMSTRKILLGYAVDIFAPLAAYWISTKLGIPVFWGLALGIAMAVISTGVNTIRRRKLDRIGALVLAEMAASIALLFWLRSPRMMLVRPSFYTGIAAIWLIVSAFRAKPLTLEGSKPFATKGDPARVAAWERAWKELPQFRLAHRLLTLGLGLAFLADAVLRVVIVYEFSIDRAAWLSNLPHLAAIAILLTCGALFGRWAAPMVDRVQQEMGQVRNGSAPSSIS